jgi:hypothetical protein
MLCVKREGGVLSSWEIFRGKSNPKEKEDTPHDRIIVEGDCS